MKTNRAVGPLGLALVMLAIVAPMAGGQTVVRPGFNIFSVDQDAEIGKPSALQVEQQLPMMSDAAAQRFVYVLLIAPGNEYAALEPTFNYIVRSLRVNESTTHN